MPATHSVGQEQRKNRPWIVISTDTFNRRSDRRLVVAVPLSSELHTLRLDAPWRVAVRDSDLVYFDHETPTPLDRVERVALGEQVRSLSEQRLLSRGARAGQSVVDDVRAGVAHILDL